MYIPYLLVLYTRRYIIRTLSYAMIYKEFTYVASILRISLYDIRSFPCRIVAVGAGRGPGQAGQLR